MEPAAPLTKLQVSVLEHAAILGAEAEGCRELQASLGNIGNSNLKNQNKGGKPRDLLRVEAEISGISRPARAAQ